MPLNRDLKLELQCEFHNSAAVQINDFAKVVEGVTSISRTTIRETEPAGWIADIAVDGSANSVRNIGDLLKAYGVERQKDVTPLEIRRRNIGQCRIGLVENVEESRPELNLLGLTDVEVLEERNIEVAPARGPKIEGRYGRTGTAKIRNRQLADIEQLVPQVLAVTQRRIS